MFLQASTKNSISDSEKREKKMLEKKLSEMEEELKVKEIFLIIETRFFGDTIMVEFKTFPNFKGKIKEILDSLLMLTSNIEEMLTEAFISYHNFLLTL